MSSSPLVWFLLLESTTGRPYKGTSADKVSAAVTDFRDAVQLKYDKPNYYLRDIPSNTLLVYKKKTTFDKRNVDEG